MTSLILILFIALQITYGVFATSSRSTAEPSTTSMKISKKKIYNYLSTNLKMNFHKATEFCRKHDMFLVSIHSKKERDNLVDYITTMGFGDERIWTSGNDLAEQGKFTWMSTGRPITYSDWYREDEPNNRIWNGVPEHCVELYGTGMHWNDALCDGKKYFVCEVL